jgi:hypothetical protein
MNNDPMPIQNIQEFYKIMNDNEDIIFRDSTLASIKDYLDTAYNGCSCRRKSNEDKAIELYKILNTRINLEVLSELKIKLNAKELIFFHDSKHLFNL